MSKRTPKAVDLAPADLDPLPLWDIIDYIANKAAKLTRSPLLDLLQSIENELSTDDPRHAVAVAAASDIAEALAAITDASRQLGELIDHEPLPDRLEHDPTLKYLTPAQMANPRVKKTGRRAKQ